MKETRILMGMPITIEILDENATKKDIEDIYEYFAYVDNTFSTYKEDSEMMKINRGEILPKEYSVDMQEIFKLSQKTKEETRGFFDIVRSDGTYEPAGIVKGWAIQHAAELIREKGFTNFYVDAGGDVQVGGKNREGGMWRVGIRNPFDRNVIVKVLCVKDCGVATSGTYIRGEHIYNPLKNHEAVNNIVSMSVIGPNIYEADRFATAAFAMGSVGINFIEDLLGFEGYMIDEKGMATYTSQFTSFVCP
jgi:thiamine biosynthesis lipoprotein